MTRCSPPSTPRTIPALITIHTPRTNLAFQHQVQSAAHPTHSLTPSLLLCDLPPPPSLPHIMLAPDCLVLNRYDLLLTADQEVAPGTSFWISVHSQYKALSPSAYAIMQVRW